MIQGELVGWICSVSMEWNSRNGLQSFIYGGNLRFRWFDKEKNDLYSSLELFYERKKWNPLANMHLI